MLGKRTLDILIIDPFAGDFSKQDNSRFLYLAHLLCASNSVELLASDFNHTKKELRGAAPTDLPFKVTFLHELGYSKNISPQRLRSHHVFGTSLAQYLESRTVPDVIYCAMPPLSSAQVVAEYAKRYGVRLVIDVQDLWPEAFQMVFHVPVVSDLIFAPLAALANSAYGRADAICAVSKTYADRALQSSDKCSSGHAVFLGTDLKTFDLGAQTPIELQKKPGEIWLGYCGTLGASYDINVVIDALYMLRQIGDAAPRFIVVGDGPRLDEFKQHAQELEVDALFMGRLPYDEMCAHLAKCDFAVNPIVRGAAGSIINKHADYAAAGIPVINTQESAEYRELVDAYAMGINCGCEDATDVAAAISILMQDAGLRDQFGRNARKCAEERFDRKKTYNELVDVIEGRQ